MGNPTPQGFDAIVEALYDGAAGASLHAATIMLLQNTSVVILNSRNLLVGEDAGPGGIPPAVIGLKEKWNTKKAARVAANATYRTARRNGRVVVMTCVASLKPVLGRSWNSAWNAVGFTNGSLEVPENPSALLDQMGDFYAANPAYEVANVNGVDCNAAGCRTAAQDINNAQTAFNAAKGAASVANIELAMGMNAGRNRIIGLKNELSQLIPNDDPRWLDYGFQTPASIASPAVPEGFTAVSNDPGEVRAGCLETERADSYRFVVRNPALPVEENVLVDEIVWEPLFIAPGLVSGMTVTVEVSARNVTGESQFTAPVTVIVA